MSDHVKKLRPTLICSGCMTTFLGRDYIISLVSGRRPPCPEQTPTGLSIQYQTTSSEISEWLLL